MAQQQDSVESNLFGIAIFTAIPWIAAFNGASHYLNKSNHNLLFLENLSSKGPMGLLMSFTYSYSIYLLIVFTVASIFVAFKNTSNDHHRRIENTVFWICISILNLSSIPLAFFYTANEPPIMSLLFYGIALIPLIFFQIKEAMFG